MLKKIFGSKKSQSHEASPAKSQQSAASSEKQKEATPQPPVKHDSVLMLEDEGKLTETLKLYLEGFMFDVTCVTNGVDGLKLIMKQDFDIILCDMMMPNLPGDMFYIAVERTKPHLCRRFIFMTGHKGDRKIEEFIRKVNGLMMWKPFHPHELLDMIKFILKKTRGE